MPLYNMTADGDLYQASTDESDGSGMERETEDVDDVDASGWAEMGGGMGVDNPAVTAERIRNDEQNENAAAQAASDNRASRKRRSMQAKARQESYSRALDGARNEERKLANMGQDPLLSMALAQQMSGADFEQYGLSGYGKTSDGSYDVDKTAAHSMGDFFSDLTSTVQSATQDAQGISQELSQVERALLPQATYTQAAPVTAPATAARAPQKAASPSIFSKKVFGIPLPILLLAGAGGAAYLWKKK